jgi:hypothetical protein
MFSSVSGIAKSEKNNTQFINEIQDSSVSIMTRLCSRQPQFDSQQGQEIFLFSYHVQTSSVAHPASDVMGAGVLSLLVKWSGMKLFPHLYLVPRSRKVELYFHFPACLHGVVLS